VKKVIITLVVIAFMAAFVSSTYAGSPIVQQVTGGGWIIAHNVCGGEESKKTFGFNAAERPDGTFVGNVEYVEHNPFGGEDHGYPHVHGFEITNLVITPDGTIAYIYGNCWLNGDKEIRAFEVTVMDVGEPGTLDTFAIWIPSLNYYAWHDLGFSDPEHGGGNIQIHVFES
jgi:hypothetical protein